MPRSRNPTPNASPFIPPLATPQPDNSPLAPVIPVAPGGSPNHLTGGLPTPGHPWTTTYPPAPYTPFAPPAMNPSFYPPSTPVWPPAVGPPPPGQPPGVSADYIGYGMNFNNTPAAGVMPLGSMWGGPTSAPAAIAGFPGAAQAQAQAQAMAAMQAQMQQQQQAAQMQQAAAARGVFAGAYTPFSQPASAPGFPPQLSGWPSAPAWNTPAPAVQPPLAPAADPWGLGAQMAGMNLDHSHSTRSSQIDSMMNIDRVDKFAAGKSYGPVLSPFLVHVLKIKLEVNPLLLPLLSAPERPTLKWCMLFASSTAYLSTDHPTKSWSAGRDAPATFPRVTEISLVSALVTFPWLTRIKAQDPALGVTCGEVVRGLWTECLEKNTSGADWNWLKSFPNGQDLQAKVGQAWKYNRSTAPGVPGGELGQGMRRLDFLQDSCWWDGIELVDTHTAEGAALMKRVLSNDVVPGGKGLPCVFVFRTDQRRMRSEQDHRQYSEAAQHRSRSRPASRSGARSGGPPSRVPSSQGRRSASRHGDIHVQEPSDSEDESGSEESESSDAGTGPPRHRRRR